MRTVAAMAGSKRATRAIDLQNARESAGLETDELARRMVQIIRIRYQDGILLARDERTYIPRVAAELDFMERVTQPTYDRTVEWWSQSQEGRAGRRPRIVLRRYDEAFAAISFGNRDLSLSDLRTAVLAARDEERKAGRSARVDALRASGRSIAALVWNAADSPRFLNIALRAELEAEVGDAPLPISGDTHIFMREVLMNIADELRVVFPGRPMIDISQTEAA